MIDKKRKNQNIFSMFFYGMIFSSKLFFGVNVHGRGFPFEYEPGLQTTNLEENARARSNLGGTGLVPPVRPDSGSPRDSEPGLTGGLIRNLGPGSPRDSEPGSTRGPRNLGPGSARGSGHSFEDSESTTEKEESPLERLKRVIPSNEHKDQIDYKDQIDLLKEVKDSLEKKSESIKSTIKKFLKNDFDFSQCAEDFHMLLMEEDSLLSPFLDHVQHLHTSEVLYKSTNSQGITKKDLADINEIIKTIYSFVDAFIKLSRELSYETTINKESIRGFKTRFEALNTGPGIEAAHEKTLILMILDALLSRDTEKSMLELLNVNPLKTKLEEIIKRMENREKTQSNTQKKPLQKPAKKKDKEKKKDEEEEKKKADEEEANKKAYEEEAKKKADKVGQVSAISPSTNDTSIKKPTKSWISKATENIPLVSSIVEKIEEIGKYISSPITSLFSRFSDLFQSFKKRLFG